VADPVRKTRYRLKWPEARTKTDYYNDLVSRLTQLHTDIADKVNDARLIGTTENSTLEGDYYNQYVVKKDDWVDRHTELRNLFTAFNTDLNNCITNALNQANLWSSRIGVMEAY